MTDILLENWGIEVTIAPRRREYWTASGGLERLHFIVEVLVLALGLAQDQAGTHANVSDPRLGVYSHIASLDCVVKKPLNFRLLIGIAIKNSPTFNILPRVPVCAHGHFEA